jgi:hypothetical protein
LRLPIAATARSLLASSFRSISRLHAVKKILSVSLHQPLGKTGEINDPMISDFVCLEGKKLYGKESNKLFQRCKENQHKAKTSTDRSLVSKKQTMSSRGPRMEGTKTKDRSFLGDKAELLILLSPVKTGNKHTRSMKKGFKLKHYVIVFSTS